MALSKETTAATVKQYGVKDTDTGNVKVQIALLTQRVAQLTAHSKAFPKDACGKRALLKVVGQRRKMLRYFERTDLEGYRAFIKELGLRK
ncbi:ribosomal protein S15 [Treponema sp. JC4]|uniref:30S ribosomal protein S15 n=1 Tax=Treponema sp. JC4 TaxID=1124982 RepID=UPI00025B0DD1|nr:30S ribosomal protein S15 [Treponema sp. JC4]EID85364.1 ribosomal protein S15 [Treponema sp. JC4]